MSLNARSKTPGPSFDNECFKAALNLAHYIVEAYSKFISKNARGEQVVFDVRCLPHPKNKIHSAYKLWILYIANAEGIERCRIQFPLLANFQDDIGEPKDLFVESMPIKSVDQKTSRINLRTSRIIATDMKLVRKVFEERVKIEKFIDSNLSNKKL